MKEEDYKRWDAQIKRMAWENDLQTIFLLVGVLGFIWGVSTLKDLKKKL